MRRRRREQLLFAKDQIRRIERGQLESMAVRDGISRASLDAISAKNAAVVVDVIDLGIAFRAADPVLGGILCRLDIDAIRRAQEAGDTLLQAIFVTLQNMHAAIPLLNHGSSQGTRAIGIVLHNRGLEHLPESNAHSLGDSGDVLEDRHTSLSIAKPVLCGAGAPPAKSR